MLTKSLRKQIGLKEIRSDWEKIKLEVWDDREFYISTDEVIQKCIYTGRVNYGKDYFFYVENDYVQKDNFDNSIKVEDLFHLKVKEFKKLYKESISLNVSKNELYVSNSLNDLTFIHEYGTEINSVKDVKVLLNSILKNKTKYQENLFHEFVTTLKPYRLKYKHGDIFRMPLRENRFGFGRIISPMKKFLNYNIPIYGGYSEGYNKKSVFDTDMFSFPTWVDFYKYQSDDPDVSIDELLECDVTSSVTIPDMYFRHKRFDIIASHDVECKSFDVPMKLAVIYNNGKADFCVFGWGAGLVTFKVSQKLLEHYKIIEYNKSKYANVQSYDNFVKDNMGDEVDFSSYSISKDLRDDDYIEVRKMISKLIKFDINLGYDEFANRFEFLNKQEIIDCSK